LASEILAKFNRPKDRVLQRNAVASNAASKAAQLPASGVRTVQPKHGPPPLASEILARFHTPKDRVLQRSAGPPNPVSKPAQTLASSNSTVQRKHGPPPLASEILAKFNETQGGSVQRRIGSLPASPGRLLQASTVQAFKLKKGGLTKNYSSKEVIGDYKKNKASGNWEATNLVKDMLEDNTFQGKGKEVAYWLHQYASSYGADDLFTVDELKVYLYDDIIREKRVIPTRGNPTPAMKTQELLTTKAGLKRIATGAQAFPINEEVRFYRGMSIGELKKLMGDATMSNEELPATGDKITKEVKANASSLGAHLGDYKQAKTYFDGPDGGALLEFVVKTDLFKPGNIALTESDNTEIAKAVKAQYSESDYAKASGSEGKHDELPGLKSESRGPYSIGLSASGKLALMAHVIRVKVIHIKRG
jgi:hypothetical protein